MHHDRGGGGIDHMLHAICHIIAPLPSLSLPPKASCNIVSPVPSRFLYAKAVGSMYFILFMLLSYILTYVIHTPYLYHVSLGIEPHVIHTPCFPRSRTSSRKNALIFPSELTCPLVRSWLLAPIGTTFHVQHYLLLRFTFFSTYNAMSL
jgi:hypothetical protein